tara:strand:- start:489 stop:641 length:153 start_codon:yes stop_codon:yes gene_type:complete
LKPEKNYRKGIEVFSQKFYLTITSRFSSEDFELLGDMKVDNENINKKAAN